MKQAQVEMNKLADKYLSQISLYPNKEVVEPYTYLVNLANSGVRRYSDYAKKCVYKINSMLGE